MPVLRWLSLCLLLVASPLLAAAPARPGPAYVVAVVPVHPPTEIRRRWQPVLDHLVRQTGLNLQFRYFDSNEAFEASIAREEPEFAMIGPWQLWLARDHYRPLLRGRTPLTGLVVVPASSPLRTLADLHGRWLGMPDGSDLAANVLLRQLLAEQKIAPRFQTTRTHANALRNVVLGRLDAAAVNNYSLRLLPAEMQPRLRVLHESPTLPGPAFAAARRVPAAVAERITAAFLYLRQHHPALLQAALMSDIEEADLERDYGMLTRFPTEAGHAPR